MKRKLWFSTVLSVFLVLAIAFPAFAGALLSYPKFFATDSSTGLPLVGGKLYTYLAGSTTINKATYSDRLCTTANTNPIVLNARAEATIYLNGIYNLILKDSNDVTIWSMDNVEATLDGGGYTFYPSSAESDHGVISTGGSLKDILTVIGTSIKATVIFLHSGAAATTSYTVATAYDASSYTNVLFKPENGALLAVSSGVTLPSPANIIAQPNQQIFSGAGTVAFTYKGTVYPEWWGALGDGTTDDSSAFTKAIATTCDIKIPFERTYYMGTTSLTVSTDGVTISGSGYSSNLLWDDAFTGTGILVSADLATFENFSVLKPRRNAAQPAVTVIGIKVTGNENRFNNISVRVTGAGTYFGHYYGWYIDSTAWSQRFFQCLGQGDGYGFSSDRANYMNIIQSVFTARASGGSYANICITGGGGHQIIGCDIEGTADYSILIDQGDADASGNCATDISGCYFEGAVSGSIYLKGYNAVARSIRGVDIHGNFLSGGSATTRSIVLVYVDGVSIHGNEIVNYVTSGVVLSQSVVNFEYSGNYNNVTTAIEFSAIWKGTYNYGEIDNSNHATSGTGEDLLNTTVLPASLMGTTGGIRIKAAGTLTGANDTKVIKLYWGVSAGGQLVATAVNAGAADVTDWEINAEIWNTATGAQRIIWSGIESDGTRLGGYDVGTVDTTAAVTVGLTGECANAGDTITQTMWRVERILD